MKKYNIYFGIKNKVPDQIQKVSFKKCLLSDECLSRLRMLMNQYWQVHTRQQACYKAKKLKKSSLKKSPAVGFKLFMKEIAVHYKLQTKHNF